MTSVPNGAFALRARLLSPLAGGGLLDIADGLLEVGEGGTIQRVEAWPEDASAPESVRDIRPLVLVPGMVDLHAHLPQLPNAGLGSGLDLLTWLDR
ncbi:MAG TPA: guanine deaminase, partial [Candidatus Limnocylindria bacterium]